MREQLASFRILCCNMGSSSLKFALYEIATGEELLVRGEIERIGLPGGSLVIRDGKGDVREQREGDFNEEQAIAALFSSFRSLGFGEPSAVGHRIVHGGHNHDAPAVVTEALLDELSALIPFAPLHMPAEIRAIEAVKRSFPDLYQVACFDTSFHMKMPEYAQSFPLPRIFWEGGLRKYGFHGLSYEYVMKALGPAGQGRVVIAHLGNGASMAAVKNGHPLDTSMGFTPTGGLIMGTRTGDLDPGVLIYLMRELGFDAAKMDDLLNRQAGLLGISGLSPDMKTLLDVRKENPAADLAITMFCYQIKKFMGAYAALLGGLDSLVFTGGIGEHAVEIRAEACDGLEHLGIIIDADRNRAHAEVISRPQSACNVRVIPTNEELMIARHTKRVVGEL